MHDTPSSILEIILEETLPTRELSFVRSKTKRGIEVEISIVRASSFYIRPVEAISVIRDNDMRTKFLHVGDKLP